MTRFAVCMYVLPVLFDRERECRGVVGGGKVTREGEGSRGASVVNTQCYGCVLLTQR